MRTSRRELAVASATTGCGVAWSYGGRYAHVLRLWGGCFGAAMPGCVGSVCVGAYEGAGEPVIDDIARMVRDKAEADVRRTGPSLGGFAAATGARVGPSAVGKAWGLDSCSSDWCRMTELAACREPCSSRADMI